MRIGFDAKRAFANKTGLGNYSRFVLDSLYNHEKGHEFIAYTPKNNKNLFPDFPQKSVIFPKTFFDRKLSAYWRYSSITTQLQKDRVSIFHGLSNEIPRGLAKANIASVVTIHDLIFEKLPSHYKAIDRAIYRHKFKSACERADAVIAISEQTKGDLIDIYRVDQNKIHVIYQDCNPVFKKTVDLQKRLEINKEYGINAPYVLCVGTIEERKNQLRLVQAFTRIKNKEFKLVLVGKQTLYTQKIHDFIAENNLIDQILILENVPTDHLPALYQEAELFAYISIYEGFGIPILEALNSGTPVLAAKGSCLEEAGGPGGLYADPYDLDDITNQLQKLLDNPGLRKSLAELGKQHMEKFTGKQIAHQLLELYTKIDRHNL
ncbi:glycosyltransferase family 1 protein [Dyadobacter sp. NIV53]|uniref:glycosyltransferase family 4 protein n=1 Tax=Dyadobacter sp. NIV53 TaxID=2861765 RepID=UPI001C87C4CB|nr:glycosyltransferase family 1 protein [Dyadobacter sp. NIV53]